MFPLPFGGGNTRSKTMTDALQQRRRELMDHLVAPFASSDYVRCVDDHRSFLSTEAARERLREATGGVYDVRMTRSQPAVTRVAPRTPGVTCTFSNIINYARACAVALNLAHMHGI